ncbi:MAG: tyrosine-type recombinase/integrase [Cyclobacteriaceae bacterium]
MIFQNQQLHFLNKKEQELILKKVENIKHKLLILLMLDAGLRVSEAVSLKLENFNFKKKILTVKSLKRRENTKRPYRTIPISDRLYKIMAEYIYQNSSIKQESYLFPSDSKRGHISRIAANNMLLRLNHKLNLKHLHPHCLRHTFATNHVANNTPLENIKEMMGHERYDTTLIYTHIPENILRKNIDTVTTEKRNMLQRIGSFFRNDSTKIINISQSNTSICIGRINEIAEVENLVNRDINVLVQGDIGTGKSHILSHVNYQKKVLKLDDADTIKTSLIYLLLYLYKNDKQAIYDLIYDDLPLDQAKTKINRLSLKNICEEIKKTVEPKEYILQIDNVDRITPKSVKVLEELKDTFTIITTARDIPLNKSSFLWNFEIIRLKPLERRFSLELINRLSYDLDIEDYELYRNHIYEQTNGNPRAIYEIIDKYRKEPVITSDTVRNIRHFGSLREIDMSIVIIIFLGCMAVLRYLTREVDNDSFRFIGGAAMVLLIIFRYLYRYTKRQFV